MLFVSWGTHFKCGVDRIERLVSYSGGFTLHGYFVEFEYKELEVKRHAGILPFYIQTPGRSSECSCKATDFCRKNSIGL